MSLQHQTVIITGGAQGIGFGIAECFARRGASIAIADINAAEAQASAAKIQAVRPCKAIGIGCDITDRLQVEAMVAQTLAAFGQVDVLINNAGISPFIDVMELSPALFSRVMNVNLTGAFHCSQVVGKHMTERGAGGRIIFISSLAPHFSQPSQAEYSASKAGVEGLMRGFATRLGREGVTCNAIAPGMILTPLTAQHWEQAGPAELIKTLVPVGRIGSSADIGRACVFLASEDAAYINGAVLPIDGGFSVLIKG